MTWPDLSGPAIALKPPRPLLGAKTDLHSLGDIPCFGTSQSDSPKMQSDSTQKKYIRRSCEDSFYSLCVSSSHTRRVRGGDAPVLWPEDQVRIVAIWNQLIGRKYQPIDRVGVELDSQAWLVR